MTKSKRTLDIPTNPYDRRAWVQYQLTIRGSSYADLARSVGCTREGLYATMFAPSARLEQVIADAIDVPVEELFSERFIDGRRVHKVRKKITSQEKLTDAAAGCTVDSSRAA